MGEIRWIAGGRRALWGIVVVAMVAAWAVAPGASAATLTLRAGVSTLSTGAPIEAVAPSSSAEGGGYVVECAYDRMNGTITAQTKGSVTITFNSALPETCEVSGGILGNNNPVSEFQEDLPWVMKLTSSGKATMVGSPLLRMTTQLSEVVCEYTSKKGSGLLETAETPAQVSFPKQKVTRLRGDDPHCPELANAAARYALSSSGTPIRAEP